MTESLHSKLHSGIFFCKTSLQGREFFNEIFLKVRTKYLFAFVCEVQLSLSHYCVREFLQEFDKNAFFRLET